MFLKNMLQNISRRSSCLLSNSDGTHVNVHLVTTCTNRKRVPVPLALCARVLPSAEKSIVQRAWLDCISKATCLMHAEDLYCGRGFFEIKKAARAIGGEFSVISAGLGLISSRKLIPSYSITISGAAEDNIIDKIGKEFFVPEEWWYTINLYSGTANPLAKLIRSKSDCIFVISVSSSYWTLIAQDLRCLSSEDFERVRIVGLAEGTVPAWARNSILPYDSRFNGPDSPLPGTLSDYPQRLCVHYISQVLPVCGLQDDQAHVRKLMSSMRAPSMLDRKRLTDDALRELMRNRLSDGGISGAQMLRWLRDEQLVACEQGRCANLYKQVAGISKDGLQKNT